MFAIESKGLTKHYSNGKIKALSDFDLSVEEGKIFSLLGPNGAGKTTLIKLLLSIALPTKGEGYIFGKTTNHQDSRKNIGYLSEDHRLPGYLNSEQFLFYYGKMSGASNYELNQKIPKLLAQVKLEDKKSLKLKKYSKGMLQRLGTAQALLNDPKLIFLDEPTDGIDPIGRIEIREILLDLKKQGKTIFINSHLLSEVERISDEIAILKEGILIKKGRTEEFLESTGKYIISVERQKSNILTDILRNKNVNFESNEYGVIATIKDSDELNYIIDVIRMEKINIENIEVLKNTLEDYFIKILK
ncbi:MAG: ABC transporter ATP-binding protein [Candidatus Delongbacteria bacterium]|nr:ABC transporter ATP-binding protein [Candidatus Delongbacteria bacterium]MCG2759678.1 ABC transporter ATP-binding protein [Candidatus Delongbacteria bacterium]